jgi:phage/plasmid-associated DNA primase
MESGLRPPAKVKRAHDDYKKQEDVVAQFVEEFCDLHDDQYERVESGKLYGKFIDEMHTRMVRKEFTQRIEAITGFKAMKSHGRWLPGITIREVSDEEKGDENRFEFDERYRT